MIDLMLPAFVAAMIIVGIHSYLGVHIIARGVIFVDLALAQVAAMGWALAELGLAQSVSTATGLPEETAAYIVGLAATLVAAALFSMSRMDNSRIPQEAIIGIVYVVASAATILLAAQAPRGAEHVEQLLTGTLLWVTWPRIWKTAALYLVLAAVHWVFRKRFMLISLHPKEAIALGYRVRLWDFVFYALFGLVVTASVSIAGVLLVFSFLVIPAVIAFLFTERSGPLLIIAWSTGIVATVVGLVVSYRGDLPTGPVVVLAFGAALVVAFAVKVVLGLRRA
ncbi:MAG TPA: iron chelate uptake ABC transporter family permease subunit [Gemmatimonadales bacterium]|jgi:zinc/manganese transport system permease protein